ncbi:hypothetical protein AVEN_113440-1 [Araneus ventricosus]|uniref:Uncharacterized protein n=1 Tax=Araneus ventricosus TaxID=182803 RepID=A0A4Y2LXB0_ARAVE|nr:hypothetical protein AVEN_113440-1 [Araneus ventricosus]
MGLLNVKFDVLSPTPFRWLKLGGWCQCRCRLRYVAAVQNYEVSPKIALMLLNGREGLEQELFPALNAHFCSHPSSNGRNQCSFSQLWMIIVTETYGDEEESILQVALLWTQGVTKAIMGFKRHVIPRQR